MGTKGMTWKVKNRKLFTKEHKKNIGNSMKEFWKTHKVVDIDFPEGLLEEKEFSKNTPYPDIS